MSQPLSSLPKGYSSSLLLTHGQYAIKTSLLGSSLTRRTSGRSYTMDSVMFWRLVMLTLGSWQESCSTVQLCGMG